MQWHLYTEDQWRAIEALALSGTSLDPWSSLPVELAAIAFRDELAMARDIDAPTPAQRRADHLARIEADRAYSDLVARRETGEPTPTPADRPLIDIDDSRLLSSANGPIPDSYTAGQHTVSAAGLVVRRGRVAITGGIDHLRDDIKYLGADIDVDSLPRDREGRIQSHALAALATRLYGLEELVGTDAVSWEQLIDANGSDVAATMVTPAVLVSHRNPSDPYAAYVDLVGRERIEWNKTHLDIDAELIDAIASMCSHQVVRRPSIKRHSVRLRLGGRKRHDDPQGSDRALVSFGDTVATRKRLSDIRKLAPGEADRVVVMVTPSNTIHVGHKTYKRAHTRHQTRALEASKRRTVKRAAIEDIHITALGKRVAAMPRGTASSFRIDGNTLRVSRSARGSWSLRVTTPTGKTIKRTDKTAPKYVVTAYANITRN